MSMLVVLNNFIRKRTITKSTDERSDCSNGQASKPYRKTSHLPSTAGLGHPLTDL